MASPASAETSSVVIILPDGVTKKTFEISRRRTVDEVKQIVLTRNYKIKGLRADYYLVVNDHDVIYPEYKKFFDSHPALEGDAAKVTVRLVPKADVIDGSDGKKTYVPKPENKSQFLSLTESANTRRKSVMLDEELERARLDAETEARRRKRMSREAKEEEQLRLKMELEEQKKREMLAAKAEEDRKRRQAERDKQEALRRQKEAEEDAVWHKLQEERRHTREEERKRLLHHSSLMIDRSKLKEVLKAGPTAVHAESQQAAAVQEPTSPHAGLSRSYAVNPTHAAAVSRTSTGSSAAEKQLEVLEEALAKAERDAAKRQKEIDALKAANAKLETDLETNKSLVSTLQLRLERTERDVERQRVVAENRAAAADREIAALKAIGTRYKAVRDGVAGELQRINSTQSESLNLVETRVVLDRVRDRLDSALSGHNWRSTKPEFSTVLFSIDELKEQLLKWPPKNPAAVAAAAEAEAEKAKAKAQPVSDTPPSTPSILISSFDSSNPPSSPAPVDATTSYETPRKPPTVEATPEVEKIANLPIEQEIDYWQVLPTFGDLLGEGGYAEVFRAEYNGRPVAVKKFKIDYQAMEDGNPPMDTDLIRKEIVILSKLNHPNIMKFYGASVIMPNICIVTELLVKGSLDVLIHDTPDFDMPFAWRVQRSIEVCQGLAYLHSVNPIVIHRDIKSANVLLDEKYTAKLSDFGLAKLKRNVFEMPSPKNSGIPPKWLVVLNSSPVGTAAWCAPEILESAPYNESSDIYSFGVFLWEFFTRLSPWTGHAAKSIIEMTIGGRRLDIPADMHPVLAELMKSSWNYDPWQRPTSADILAKLKSLQH